MKTFFFSTCKLLPLLFSSSLTFADVQTDMTQAHNQIRHKVNNGLPIDGALVQPIPNPGLSDLVWATEMAKAAEEYAKLCRTSHDPNTTDGENLAWGYPTATAAVAGWAVEVKEYLYDTNSCRQGSCGHYTQLVWGNTGQFGCGTADCSSKGLGKMWVCRYRPGGNVIGEWPYFAVNRVAGTHTVTANPPNAALTSIQVDDNGAVYISGGSGTPIAGTWAGPTFTTTGNAMSDGLVINGKFNFTPGATTATQFTGTITETPPTVQSQKVCSVFLPPSFRDSIVVPKTWGLTDCNSFRKIAGLDYDATQYQLGCLNSTGVVYGSAGNDNTNAGFPTPDCGWALPDVHPQPAQKACLVYDDRTSSHNRWRDAFESPAQMKKEACEKYMTATNAVHYKLACINEHRFVSGAKDGGLPSPNCGWGVKTEPSTAAAKICSAVTRYQASPWRDTLNVGMEWTISICETYAHTVGAAAADYGCISAKDGIVLGKQPLESSVCQWRWQ